MKHLNNLLILSFFVLGLAFVPSIVEAVPPPECTDPDASCWPPAPPSGPPGPALDARFIPPGGGLLTASTTVNLGQAFGLYIADSADLPDRWESYTNPGNPPQANECAYSWSYTPVQRAVNDTGSWMTSSSRYAGTYSSPYQYGGPANFRFTLMQGFRVYNTVNNQDRTDIANYKREAMTTAQNPGFEQSFLDPYYWFIHPQGVNQSEARHENITPDKTGQHNIKVETGVVATRTFKRYPSGTGCTPPNNQPQTEQWISLRETKNLTLNVRPYNRDVNVRVVDINGDSVTGVNWSINYNSTTYTGTNTNTVSNVPTYSEGRPATLSVSALPAGYSVSVIANNSSEACSPLRATPACATISLKAPDTHPLTGNMNIGSTPEFTIVVATQAQGQATVNLTSNQATTATVEKPGPVTQPFTLAPNVTQSTSFDPGTGTFLSIITFDDKVGTEIVTVTYPDGSVRGPILFPSGQPQITEPLDRGDTVSVSIEYPTVPPVPISLRATVTDATGEGSVTTTEAGEPFSIILYEENVPYTIDWEASGVDECEYDEWMGPGNEENTMRGETQSSEDEAIQYVCYARASQSVGGGTNSPAFIQVFTGYIFVDVREGPMPEPSATLSCVVDNTDGGQTSLLDSIFSPLKVFAQIIGDNGGKDSDDKEGPGGIRAQVGDVVRFDWSTMGVQYCNSEAWMEGGEYTPNFLSGWSRMTQDKEGTNEYVLACTGMNGQKISRSCTVDVSSEPIESACSIEDFSVSAGGESGRSVTVNPDGYFTLDWTVNDAQILLRRDQWEEKDDPQSLDLPQGQETLTAPSELGSYWYGIEGYVDEGEPSCAYDRVRVNVVDEASYSYILSVKGELVITGTTGTSNNAEVGIVPRGSFIDPVSLSYTLPPELEGKAMLSFSDNTLSYLSKTGEYEKANASVTLSERVATGRYGILIRSSGGGASSSKTLWLTVKNLVNEDIEEF